MDVTLRQAELDPPEDQILRFVSTFDRGVAPRLKTPRVGKRYGNAVMFRLAMIGDEMSRVVLLLIEAMRVFYPLCEWVRDHPHEGLGHYLPRHMADQAKAQSKALSRRRSTDLGPTRWRRGIPS